LRMICVRFLEKGEEMRLPKGAKLLPKSWRRGCAEKWKPFYVEGDVAVLQTEAENGMTQVWRKNAVKLLERLKKEGVEVIIPPIEGELPRDILPFAEGRRLTNLFAFKGAAEALKRRGKNPETCHYLLAGGTEEDWRGALASMGNEVNHLAIFTSDPDGAKGLVQELFAEHGLMAEVFASPKNPVFSQADVVFCCGMEQRPYEHMLGEGAVWIDLAGNRPVLRRLASARPDVVAVDGFFFRKGKKQVEGRYAEGEAYLSCPIFRGNWRFPLEKDMARAILGELGERGYALSGFSFLGKRVKIRKKP